MSSGYKHVAEVTRHFGKAFKSLDRELRESIEYHRRPPNGDNLR